MYNLLINGFIRPDASILKGNNHNTLAREELKNKENLNYLKNFIVDPYCSPQQNLINANYLLVSLYTIILPTNPTKPQLDVLINMISSCSIDNIPEFDSMSLNSLKILSNLIITENNPTLKFVKSYLEEIYNSKTSDNELEH